MNIKRLEGELILASALPVALPYGLGRRREHLPRVQHLHEPEVRHGQHHAHDACGSGLKGREGSASFARRRRVESSACLDKRKSWRRWVGRRLAPVTMAVSFAPLTSSLSSSGSLAVGGTVDSAAGASSSLARTIVERDLSRLAAIVALRAPGVVPMRTALGARTTETTRVLDEDAARHPTMTAELWRTKVDISRWDVPRGY